MRKKSLKKRKKRVFRGSARKKCRKWRYQSSCGLPPLSSRIVLQHVPAEISPFCSFFLVPFSFSANKASSKKRKLHRTAVEVKNTRRHCLAGTSFVFLAKSMREVCEIEARLDCPAFANVSSSFRINIRSAAIFLLRGRRPTRSFCERIRDRKFSQFVNYGLMGELLTLVIQVCLFLFFFLNFCCQSNV